MEGCEDPRDRGYMGPLKKSANIRYSFVGFFVFVFVFFNYLLVTNSPVRAEAGAMQWLMFKLELF